MIEAIKKLYHVEDLTGEVLLRPLKEYHGFFLKEICYTSHKLKALAIMVSCIAVGIVVYPLLGLFALVGMGIKYIHIPEVQKHNQRQKELIGNMCSGVRCSTAASVGLPEPYLLENGYKETFLKTVYQLDKSCADHIDKQLSKVIDNFTALYAKVYITGEIDEFMTKSKIAIRLALRHHS